MNSYKYVCKGGLPCDFRLREDPITHAPLDFRSYKLEICIICGRKIKFNKYNSRLNNVLYLETHPRDFCQRWGKFKKLYAQLYGLKKRDLRMKGTNVATR